MSGQLFMWAFGWVVTVFDAGFAWVHRQTFSQWEMNPVADSLTERWGIGAVLAFRLFTVAWACVIIRLARHRLRSLATRFVFAVHVALLLVYGQLLIP